MKKLLLLALLPVMAFAQSPDETGFVPMTNGKDLTGWKKVGGNGEFKVEGGEIVGTGMNVNGNTFLISEKTYRNFDSASR